MAILDVDPDEINRLSNESVSDWFWNIIERSNGDRGNLTSILNDFTKEEIRRFKKEFDIAVFLLFNDDVIERMGRVSEDEIIEISEWIVSQGKGYYEQTLAGPKEIRKWEKIDHESSLALIPNSVYRKRFGERLSS
jgi:hypothetical protein